MNHQAIDMFEATIKQQDEHIWVKPICDFFDISYKNSKRKILDDPILASLGTKKSRESLFGDKHPRVALPKKGFIRWINIINANTVRDDLRDQFIQYQSSIFDFLYGSMEQNRRVRTLYRRRKKLKKYKTKYAREIRAIDKQLARHWDRRYLQGQFGFNGTGELEA